MNVRSPKGVLHSGFFIDPKKEHTYTQLIEELWKSKKSKNTIEEISRLLYQIGNFK